MVSNTNIKCDICGSMFEVRFVNGTQLNEYCQNCGARINERYLNALKQITNDSHIDFNQHPSMRVGRVGYSLAREKRVYRNGELVEVDTQNGLQMMQQMGGQAAGMIKKVIIGVSIAVTVVVIIVFAVLFSLIR